MDKCKYIDGIIDGLGGTCATARMCGIRFASVSRWRKKGIPRAWLAYFRAVRPDLFNESVDPQRLSMPEPELLDPPDLMERLAQTESAMHGAGIKDVGP
ncbi:MAG: hypothetical protein LBE06_05970 [Azoarcus sp.]|jgi:hypothetical protein|nr:hypothetical protein [Azoarcus sp.]